MRLFTKMMGTKEALLLNPLQLAYMGDAVWELIVRGRMVAMRYNVHHMHSECVRLVNAKAQASFIRDMKSILNEIESDIVVRGRNTHARHPVPKNQDPADYADATSFEALIGFLYVTDQQDRLLSLCEYIFGKDENHG